MIELRLHRELYEGAAVDEAAKVYADYGALALVEEPTHWVVRVTPAADAEGDARTLAAELANYALGLTIERRTGARPGGGAA